MGHQPAARARWTSLRSLGSCWRAMIAEKATSHLRKRRRDIRICMHPNHTRSSSFTRHINAIFPSIHPSCCMHVCMRFRLQPACLRACMQGGPGSLLKALIRHSFCCWRSCIDAPNWPSPLAALKTVNASAIYSGTGTAPRPRRPHQTPIRLPIECDHCTEWHMALPVAYHARSDTSADKHPWTKSQLDWQHTGTFFVPASPFLPYGASRLLLPGRGETALPA